MLNFVFGVLGFSIIFSVLVSEDLRDFLGRHPVITGLSVLIFVVSYCSLYTLLPSAEEISGQVLKMYLNT